MRRVLPLVLATALALSGCSRNAALASADPSLSPSVEASEATHTPDGSAPPVPSAASRATGSAPYSSRCDRPTVAVNSARATAIGPYGSKQTTGSAAIALTFDDGPDPVNTPLMLDVLRRCGVKATFCVVGYKAAMFPDVIRRMVSEGHTLCNHSWQHNTQLGTYDRDSIRQDLQRTNDAIHRIVPDVRVSYFRAPGGLWTADYATVAHQLGMTPLDWDVDPKDWNLPMYGTGKAMTLHIVSWVESHVRPGSIVLSHDYQKPATTAAYRILLPWLTARFKLIPLPPAPVT